MTIRNLAVHNMRIVLICFLLLAWPCFSAQKTLKVAVNIGPPWAFQPAGQEVTGIDVEILRHVFQQMGYATEFHLLGYSRLIKDFNEGKFDVASPAAFESNSGFQTQPYLPFQDVVVSLQSEQQKIKHTDDLKGKRIVTYQFAHAVLADQLSHVIQDTNYLEVADRELQLRLLVNNRTDVVIGERRLLTHIFKQYYPQEQFSIHPIFVAKSYGAIIKDKQLQLQFDQELTKLMASDKYQQLLKQWP
ncbi:substrate-binding periplasmic protein [Rheinheimera sp. UJ63]|uniref:substrate-binding periplasmic protein n=1 Tax=Rheinheimera sp. UJ63 TaxID=2910157 RepID=UPI001F479E73|nr:transporter substrate-binding domain-containing protein [Rheinheimera sp. UJ63]MCF4010842.1 transporter substrate-binding domain-containing protein [Rheinheimera sp. UJ63]